jgi:hypothetical protein
MIVEIKNVRKKSVEEIEMFFNEETKFGLSIRSGWRSGTARVEVDSLEDLLEQSGNESFDDEDFELDAAAFDSFEMIETWDGCWTDIDVWKKDASESELEEMQEAVEVAWDEDYFTGIEELGFHNTDYEFYFYGPVTVEIVEK